LRRRLAAALIEIHDAGTTWLTWRYATASGKLVRGCNH
jgi:hypothetical protein